MNPSFYYVGLGEQETGSATCHLVMYTDDNGKFWGILIDAGLGYGLGGERVIPNYEGLHHLLDPDSIAAVLITHGHQDHVGTLGLLVDGYDRGEIIIPPIVSGRTTFFSTRFTRCTINSKVTDRVSWVDMKHGDEACLPGGVRIYAYYARHITGHLCWSIKGPDWSALFLGDAQGSLADFNLIASQGPYNLVVFDATAAEASGQFYPDLKYLTKQSAQVAAQHADRRLFFPVPIKDPEYIQHIIYGAGRRTVCLLGSLEKYVKLAVEDGLIQLENIIFVNQEDAAKAPRGEVVYFVPGTQGGQRSTLSKLASGEWSGINLDPSDVFVFSVAIMPGNQQRLSLVEDELFNRGVKTVYLIPISNHATRSEILRMLKALSPQIAVPTHAGIDLCERLQAYLRTRGINVLLVEGQRVLAVRPNGFPDESPWYLPGTPLYVEGRNLDLIKRKAGSVLVEGLRISRDSGMFVRWSDEWGNPTSRITSRINVIGKGERDWPSIRALVQRTLWRCEQDLPRWLKSLSPREINQLLVGRISEVISPYIQKRPRGGGCSVEVRVTIV